MNEYLLADEVARKARTTVSTVRYWVKSGKLRGHRPGRRLLFHRSDVDAFLTGEPANTQNANDTERRQA